MHPFKILMIFFLLFSFFLMTSCNGSKKIDVPKENITQPKKPEKKLMDHDPYFTESESITSSNGPSSITRNIIQDRKGNIWMASWEGIIGYDGKSFTNYTNKNGLKRFHTFSVFEDKKGNIWFGTIGAGIYRYDGESFKHFTMEDGLVGNSVTNISEDKKGNIWFGAIQGVSCYNGNYMSAEKTSFRNFTKADGLTDNDVNAIIEDRNGIFWFATRGHACYYDGLTFTNFKNTNGNSFTNVRSLIEDSNGNIWLGGNDGLWCYDGKLFTQLTTSFIGNIFEDSKGRIWVSQSNPNNTYTMSLYRYESSFLYFNRPEATLITKGNGQVFGIMEDRKGNIWFGLEQGICRYDGKTFEYFNGK